MITFTKIPSETDFNFAYNNNIAEYTSNIANIRYSVITIEGKEFQITPNPSGVFTFNFIDVIPHLINTNKFEDTIVPNVSSNLVYPDATAFKKLSVEFKVVTNSADDTITKEFTFIKAAEQLEDYKKGLTNSQNPELAILSPFTSLNNKAYYATYFEGYPFDISLWSKGVDVDIVIKNVKTQDSLDVTLIQGVNRLFISDGSSNWTFEEQLSLYFGVNELTFSFGAEHITLFLKKVESECGIYVKWLNNSGGWNYFLFKYMIEDRGRSSIGYLNQDQNALNNSGDLEAELGVDARDGITFYADRLEEYEKQLINGLSISPKIYRYLNCMFQHPNNWIAERYNGSNIVLKDKSRRLYDAVIKLNKSKRNTLTL